MASEEVLDFTQLLAPIPGENPAGEDLREDFSHDSVYRQIRAARSEAREAERRVVYHDEPDVDPGEPADWRPVLELAPRAIAERSKDLEIVAYLTEALVRRDGYPGLRDGFRLARELIEQYWDNIFPLPDEEEGIAARVSPLSNLNGIEGEGLLIWPITKIPITDGTGLGPYSALDYRLASEADVESDPDKRARRLDQPGFVTKKMFDGAVSETTADWFRNLLEDIDQCVAAFEKLCEVLEEKCGKDESGYPQAPPSSSIRSTLQDCRGTVVSISRHLLEIEEEPAEGEGGALAAGGGEISQVRTREEAFKALLRAADFFKRTEPHSPVGPALEKVVRWGRMDLVELFQELIEDDSSREGVFKLIGIKPPAEPEETY